MNIFLIKKKMETEHKGAVKITSPRPRRFLLSVFVPFVVVLMAAGINTVEES
jgi:hypothetical protein